MKIQKFVLMFVLCLVSTTGISLAVDPCQVDFDELCGTVRAGNGVLAKCIERNWDQIGHPCKEYLKRLERPLRDLQEACGWDARAFCRDVRPGYKRIANCLDHNFDKLSESCQNKITAFKAQN